MDNETLALVVALFLTAATCAKVGKEFAPESADGALDYVFGVVGVVFIVVALVAAVMLSWLTFDALVGR